MIKSYINQSDFVDALTKTYDNTNFTYNGKVALFEHLEQLSDDIGEDIELDPIALCCEYSEYRTADEAASEHFTYQGMVFDEEGNETMTADEVEAIALKFLEENTQVIQFDGGIIIQSF